MQSLQETISIYILYHIYIYIYIYCIVLKFPKKKNNLESISIYIIYNPKSPLCSTVFVQSTVDPPLLGHFSASSRPGHRPAAFRRRAGTRRTRSHRSSKNPRERVMTYIHGLWWKNANIGNHIWNRWRSLAQNHESHEWWILWIVDFPDIQDLQEKRR